MACAGYAGYHRVPILLAMILVLSTPGMTVADSSGNCSTWNINYQTYGNYSLKCRHLNPHVVTIQGVEFKNFSCNATENCYPETVFVAGVKIVNQCYYSGVENATLAVSHLLQQ